MMTSPVLCTLLSSVAALNMVMEAVCVGGAQYLYSHVCVCVAFLKYSNLEGLVMFSVLLLIPFSITKKTRCKLAF